ncbi:polyprenyl synthetase family protein [Antarctobacter jejuensis]|uniref:polyprenyl synthetase family protein n=1 Tax=Antarctobacter jejuensis TaxID=1439938 RepID=UPI003FD19146
MQMPVRDMPDVSTSVRHDLSPRAEADTEWWYLQGRIQIAGQGARNLMVMLLRRRGQHPPHADGWNLLVSVIDPVSGAKSVISHACGALVRNMDAELVDTLIKGGMPEALAQAYRDELSAYGPPDPVRVSSDPLSVGGQRLDIGWGRFALRQEAGGAVTLTVPVPDSDGLLTLWLSPERPWQQDENVGAQTDFGAMRYALCTRMAATGDIDGAIVTGTAWLDHQWGGDNWFQPGARDGQVLGWEWLGVTLDDGRDLLIITARDMISGDIIDRSAALLTPDAPRRMLDRLDTRATDHWISPDTHARYPIGWQVDLPDIAATLTFTPDTPDCEVPFYGILGAVWEGGGRITGQIDGQQVHGRGHLELFGHASPACFEATKARWIDRIDAHIAQLLPRTPTDDWLTDTAGPTHHRYDTAAFGPMLSDPCWALMSRGGKHWRAILAILLLRALGTDVPRYEALITTLPEMLHAGSLMIDDIQDHSALRRGGPAIHHLYGPEITINAANTLYFLPLRQISRHPHLDLAQRETIQRIALDLFVAAHFGQAQDLYSQNWRINDVLAAPAQHAQMVLQTYALKTAAPVRALAEMICTIGRSTPALTSAAQDFAQAAGTAYQVMDDVNSFSATRDWGKDTGEDIREGRLTYVILRALDMAPKPQRARLATLISGDMTDADQQEACALVTASGALHACRAEARAMIDTPWRALSKHLPPSPSKTMLRLMFERLFIPADAHRS